MVSDADFESHQFLSPDGSLFERIGSDCLADEHEETTEGIGKIWIVTDEVTHGIRFFVRRKGMITVCDRLSELIQAIHDESPPAPFDLTSLEPTEKVQRLA